MEIGRNAQDIENLRPEFSTDVGGGIVTVPYRAQGFVERKGVDIKGVEREFAVVLKE